MRNLGLDLVRASAILLVLFCHGISILYIPSHKSSTIEGIMYASGFIGVEIFFVLSGFLIGKIIIHDVIQDSSISSLKKFYIRRWLRTLPLYFLVVFVLFATGKQINWESLIFIQNFDWRNLPFFPVSWSLAVEEWFYLIIPLVFLLSFKLWKAEKRLVFFAVCLSFIFVELGWRFYETLNHKPSFDFHIRKQIYLRMDSLMTGVLLAGIKAFFKDAYRFLFSVRSSLLLACSSCGFLFGVYGVFHLASTGTMDTSIWGRTVLFTWISIFIAFLIGWFDSRNYQAVPSKLAAVITFISLTSYSVYLIHYDLMGYISKLITTTGLVGMLTEYILSIALIYALSTILYRYWEKPFMNLRNSITESKNSVTERVVKAP